MKTLTKYITPNKESKDWGFYINVIGSNEVDPNTNYPLKGHPDKYLFNWEVGRIHEDFHLIYITRGRGVFENEHHTYKVEGGDIILINSGEWHRYKPDAETGWHENYIGFNGDVAKHFVKVILGYTKNPIFSVGKNEVILELFDRVLKTVENEKPCYQLTASSIVIDIISRIISFFKQKDFDSTSNKTAEVINDVRFLIRDNIENELDFKKIAEERNMTYAHFRKMFKKYTGFSPLQYHLHLKINKAKEMLLDTNMSVKEIAFELGFKSIHYFGRLFKQKTNTRPSDLRKKNSNKRIY